MSGGQGECEPSAVEADVRIDRCSHGKARCLEACAQCWMSLMTQTQRVMGMQARLGKRVGDMNIICEHGSERRRCRACKGSWICVHDKNKVYCAECDGRRLCQCCKKKNMPRCYEICKKCREQHKDLGDLYRKKFKPHI